MEFAFKIDNSIIFDISQKNEVNFEIGSMPEKEYIEKKLNPVRYLFQLTHLLWIWYRQFSELKKRRTT